MANKIAQLNLFNKKNVSNKHLINEKIRLIQLAAEQYNNQLNYIHRSRFNQNNQVSEPIISEPIQIPSDQPTNFKNHLEVSQSSFNSNKNVNKSNHNSNSQKNIVSFMDCVILHKQTNYL